MTNRLQSLFLALAASGLTGAALAQNSPDGMDHDGGPEAPAPRGWHGHQGDGPEGGHWHKDWRGNPEMEFRGLDLTPEQHRRMQIIVLNARVQELQQQDAHKGSPKDEFEALMNPGDPNYATAVQDAKKRAAERIQHMSDLRLQLYNVLTPEQKAAFARRIAEHREHAAARGEHEGFRGPPAPAAR